MIRGELEQEHKVIDGKSERVPVSIRCNSHKVRNGQLSNGIKMPFPKFPQSFQNLFLS